MVTFHSIGSTNQAVPFPNPENPNSCQYEIKQSGTRPVSALMCSSVQAGPGIENGSFVRNNSKSSSANVTPPQSDVHDRIPILG